MVNQLQALKISQSLGDESSQVGFGAGKRWKPWRIIPSQDGRHVTYISGFFLCAYGEWFFVPYKLGCSRTPSKWPKWLINGGDPKHLLTSPGYVRPGSRSSKWVASQPTLPLTYPAWLWLGLTIGFRGPLGVAGWPVSTGCCNDFV